MWMAFDSMMCRSIGMVRRDRLCEPGLLDLSVCKSKKGAVDHYQRFFDAAGNINLIQIAEYLPDPPDILAGSYSTGTWQDGTLWAAVTVRRAAGAIEQLGLQLGLNGYPKSVTVNGDTLPKTGLQYIENHDH